MLLTMAGAMSTAELGLVAGRDDPRRTRCTASAHRRQPGGGHLQPGGARPLRARPELPRPLGAEDEKALLDARPQPRHRHLHPRRRGDAPDRAPHARPLGQGVARAASATSPTSTCTSSCARAACVAELPDRPARTPGCSRPRAQSADLRARLGGLDPGQRLRRRRASAATSMHDMREDRPRAT